MLAVHTQIKARLGKYLVGGEVPHLLFNGESGSGKHALLREFVRSIYGNDEAVMEERVLSVNCAHGVGVNFVRDRIVFFAEKLAGGKLFKCVVLFNADQLSTEAQSALRRCIEVHSWSTRFFLSASNCQRLMDPIVSRLCEVCVPMPVVGRKRTNLHGAQVDVPRDLRSRVRAHLASDAKDGAFVQALYEEGWSGLDVMGCLARVHLVHAQAMAEVHDEQLLMLMALEALRNEP
jgi:hypothetical protein